VQCFLSLATMYKSVEKVLRKIIVCRVLLDLREGSGEGAEETEQTYEEAIAEMVESGMVASYDVRYQRKYGGRPAKELELDSKSSSEMEPEPESLSTEAPEPIFDILGHPDKPLIEGPPPPSEAEHVRGARSRGSLWEESNLRAPPEPAQEPADKQVTAEQLRIRQADSDLVPKLPKELAYKPLRVPGGAARTFVTGKDELEVRAASTRLKVTVHDKRTVRM
jgi:hypothetical protein